MNNTITINEFTAICNEYLDDNTASFVNFLHASNYLDSKNNFAVSGYEVEDKRLIKALNKVSLNFKDFAKNKEKFAKIVDFFANNQNLIENTNSLTKEKFLKSITQQLAKNDLYLNLPANSQKKLEQNIKMYDPKMVVPKSHPKLNFLRKKVLKPALIVGAACGVGASILSAVSVIANSSFLSPSLIVSIGAWASAGALVGAGATAITSIAISKLTRNYYAKKYCEKANNIEAMMNAGIETLEDLENSNTILPIKELMDKLEKTNKKVCENKNGNWFKRVIANGLYYKKVHRNQLWALASYVKNIKTQAKDEHNGETYNRYNALLSYIDKNLSKDARRNFIDYSTDYNKLDNCDIYATIALGKANKNPNRVGSKQSKKEALREIKEKCYQLVTKLSAERYSSANENIFNLHVDEGIVGEQDSDIVNEQKFVTPIENRFNDIKYIENQAEHIKRGEVIILPAKLNETEDDKTEPVQEEKPATETKPANDEKGKKLISTMINKNKQINNTISVKINDKLKTKYKITATFQGNTKKLEVKKSGNIETDQTMINAAINSVVSNCISVLSEKPNVKISKNDEIAPNTEQLAMNFDN